MIMNFFKAEGTGNDFIVMHNPNGRPPWLNKETVVNLCDRHFGIGSDGILSIENSDKADLFMRIINPDGTEAEMCGNGIRVVTLYAIEVLGLDKNPVMVQTPAGIKACTWKSHTRNTAFVSVAMGKPVVRNFKVSIPGATFVGWSVSTGNPHFVVPSSNPGQDALKYGQILSTHSSFPAGANIEFLKKTGETACELAVYERGAGLTLSCGSGTTAAIAATVSAEIFPKNRPIKVELPGGTLSITINDQHEALLSGPARLVFQGTMVL